ncbi:hypothetical protein [Rhodopila globiformis]|uniref:hypothetical protein n=1 Tax=Rhodopila globiformis TaxID=1071 RepID=UPI0011B0231E|nr:hypothetical protein [Rhodopila globiformis]
MRERDFQALLDRFGPDLSRWRDAALRRSAEALLTSSVEARAMLARASRLAALIDAATTPPLPPVARIVERATARPQVPVRRPTLPTRPAWLGLGRWHAVAFASCLVVGVLIGIRSAHHPDNAYALYNVADGSDIGDLHE